MSAAVLLLVFRLLSTGIFQIVGSIVVLALAALIYKMTILIDEFRLKFSMGVGIIGDEILMGQIESCCVYPQPIGWGIRFNSEMSVYNITSKQAVEIVIKNQRKRILIGCDNPDEVVEAIQSYIKH